MDKLVIDTVADPETIGIRELLAEAWAARWAVLVITAAFTVIGGIASVLVPKQFRAEILVAPTDSPTNIGGGLGSLASQYGALASLAGVSLSGKSSKAEAIAVLQSELITEAYIRENNLLPVLYFDRWDSRAGSWKSNDARKIPTLWKANRYFKSIREVKEDRQSGLVTLRITWRDADQAAKWANDLVTITNRYLRDKAIKESERNITYLDEQAAKTNVIEVKTAIYSILKDEVNKQMIARGREEYALKVLDPARSPEVKSSASALFLCSMGFAVGLVISGLFVWRRSSGARTNPKADVRSSNAS
jgi:LPS O-antigen subunit length determinant protein (WzzB/FepE family)